MNLRRGPVVPVFVLALAATQVAAQSLLTLHGEDVLAVGDPIPGLPGITVSSAAGGVGQSVIDQNANYLIVAKLAGPVSTIDDRAYLLGCAGNVQVIVRSGDQAPGLPVGVTLRSDVVASASNGLSSAPVISPFGRNLLFSSALFDGGVTVNASNNVALFAGTPGNFVVVARRGSPVPFVAVNPPNYGLFSASESTSGVTSNGRVLFQTELVGGDVSGGSNNAAVVTGAAGALELVVRDGEAMPDGAVVMPVSGDTTMGTQFAMNDAGHVLLQLRFSTTTGTATTANDRALAVWRPGIGKTILAREGQQAPGLPFGVAFATPTSAWVPDLGVMTLTRGGVTAFRAPLTGGGTVAGVDDAAVYRGGPNGITLVARRGDASSVPGVNLNVLGGVMCDDEGRVAFTASLTGAVTTADDSGWFVASGGQVTMLMREGDVVAQLPPTGNGPWRLSSASSSPRLIDGGRLLLIATATDGVDLRPVVLGFVPGLGWQVVLDRSETGASPLGAGTMNGVAFGSNTSNGDGNVPWINSSGDFVVLGNYDNVGRIVHRVHLGSLQATPSTIDTVIGGAQNFAIDCGSAQAFRLHLVLGTTSGIRPGFPSPLGPQLVPLNPDFWTQTTLDFAGTSVYPNSIGFLDANGRANAAFVLPPGIIGLAGTTLHHAVAVLELSNLTSTFVSEPAALQCK